MAANCDNDGIFTITSNPRYELDNRQKMDLDMIDPKVIIAYCSHFLRFAFFFAFFAGGCGTTSAVISDGANRQSPSSTTPMPIRFLVVLSLMSLLSSAAAWSFSA